MSASEATITPPKTPPSLTPDDIRELFNEFISKRSMTPEAGGAQLMADNAELRGDKRRLKDKITDLEAKVPADGSLILTGNDAKLFQAAKAVLETLPTDKRTAEELGKMLKEHGELTLKVTNLERQSVVVQIAEAEGWKVSALLKLAKDMDLVLESVEEEVDDEENEGKKKKVTVQRGFVQTKDAAGVVTKKRLTDELKDFMPSLVKEHGDGQASDEEHHEETAGTSFVRQSRGDKGTAKTTNVSKDFLKGRYKVPGDDKK